MASRSTDRVLFTGEVVSLGQVRCGVHDPAFARPSQVSGYRIVFPRHAVWIRTSRASRFRSDATVVEFHNDGDEFCRAPLDPRGDSTEWFELSRPLVVDLVERHDPRALEGRYPFRLACAATDTHAYAAQRALFRAVNDGVADELALEEAVITIVERVLGTTSERSRRASYISRHEREVAERTQRVLDRIGVQRASLVQISREVGVSVFHLCRIFHKVTGMTLARHHLRRRLLASLDALEDAGRSIPEVALTHGFRGRAHFGQAFQRVFGTSPAEWRRSRRGRVSVLPFPDVRLASGGGAFRLVVGGDQ